MKEKITRTNRDLGYKWMWYLNFRDFPSNIQFYSKIIRYTGADNSGMLDHTIIIPHIFVLCYQGVKRMITIVSIFKFKLNNVFSNSFGFSVLSAWSFYFLITCRVNKMDWPGLNILKEWVFALLYSLSFIFIITGVWRNHRKINITRFSWRCWDHGYYSFSCSISDFSRGFKTYYEVRRQKWGISTKLMIRKRELSKITNISEIL